MTMIIGSVIVIYMLDLWLNHFTYGVLCGFYSPSLQMRKTKAQQVGKCVGGQSCELKESSLGLTLWRGCS